MIKKGKWTAPGTFTIIGIEVPDIAAGASRHLVKGFFSERWSRRRARGLAEVGDI
jgi:hypothetical protein